MCASDSSAYSVLCLFLLFSVFSLFKLKVRTTKLIYSIYFFFVVSSARDGVGTHSMHCSMTGCKIRTIEIYRTINDFSLSPLSVQMVTM